MNISKPNLSSLSTECERTAIMLRARANGRRLMIPRLLIQNSEASAGDLARQIGLSPSAMSQHLARMCEEGLVAVRREGQTMYYRIADPTVTRLIQALERAYASESA